MLGGINNLLDCYISSIRSRTKERTKMYCKKRNINIKNPDDCCYCFYIPTNKKKPFDEDKWHKDNGIIALG